MNGSRFAPRDPAVEAALADLGTARRDYISAYEDRRSGLTPREERAQRLQVREEQEGRRAALDRAAANGDGTARALGAWNNSANFDADPMALRSEDIAGGQAHRGRLRALVTSGQVRDLDEPRASRGFGENRNGPAPARNISDAGYTTAGGAETGADGGHRSVSSSTPRSFPGLQSPQIPTNSNRDCLPPARPDGHVRPTSPRLHGSTRFGPGGRVTKRPAAAMDASSQAATAARPSIPAPAPTASTPTSSTSRARVAPAASVSTPPRLAAAVATIPPTPPTTSAAIRPAAPPTRGAAAAPVYTRWQPSNYTELTTVQFRALYYAAERGSAYDNFLASQAGAARLLEDARRALVFEITKLIKAGDNRDVTGYNQCHKERRWMVEAALKARDLLEHASDQEVLAHYANNPDHTDFFETAKKEHGSERTVSVGTTDSSLAAAPTGMVMSSSQINTSAGQTPSVANGAATQPAPTLLNADHTLVKSENTAPPAASTTSGAASTASNRTALPAHTATVVQAPAPAPSPMRTTATVPPHLRSTANRAGPASPAAGSNSAAPSMASINGSDSTEQHITQPTRPANPAPAPAAVRTTHIAPHLRSATNRTFSASSVAESSITEHTIRTAHPATQAPTTTPVQPVQTAPHLRSTTNGQTLQPNGSVSTASSRSSVRSAAPDVTIPLKHRGVMNVTYIDNEGNFVKHEQIKHYSAVNMTITVNSTQDGVDPIAAFAPFKAIAEQSKTKNTPAPRVVKLVDEGIYGSDEEL